MLGKIRQYTRYFRGVILATLDEQTKAQLEAFRWAWRCVRGIARFIWIKLHAHLNPPLLLISKVHGIKAHGIWWYWVRYWSHVPRPTIWKKYKMQLQSFMCQRTHAIIERIWTSTWRTRTTKHWVGSTNASLNTRLSLFTCVKNSLINYSTIFLLKA